ncbi:MAG TPA: hypothetical protein VFE78_32570, partial [Gemmataceae bacterium]|nr:hypothetical protein [Gemmataceae bacterium]
MLNATPTPPARRRLAPAAALLLAVLPAAAPAQAPQGSGLVIQVPTTLTTLETNRLRNALLRPLKLYEAARQNDQRRAGSFKLVCDFNPEGRPTASDDFGACYELAKYLRSLQKEGIQTVAWLHGDVSRHSVLPVLACSKIVMSAEPRARLGRVAAGGKTLPRSERAAYEDGEVVAAHGAPVLVRKTYDPAVSVVEIKPPPKSGPRYLDAADKPRPKGELVADLGPGETAFYSFAQARDFGICEQAPCNDVDAVLALCDLPRSSLARPLDRVSAWRLVVAGTVNGELKEKVQRRVKRALGHRDRPNLLVLQLECGDGESQTAHELALFLAGLNEGRPDNPVQTVAFVTPQARNTAAFLAFACNKIVMQREAKLGDFDAYMKDRPTLEATVRKNLSEVAGKQHYPVLLADGMLSRELRIHRVESVKGGSARAFLSDDDFRADQGQGGEHRWRSLGLVKPQAEADENKYLTLTAERARELGVAQEVVPSFEKRCELEGVNPADVHTADSDWLDSLADFLRDPWTSVVLVMLGITCLILELKMPGVGLPGVIAAICFVLFFWAHSQLNGQITWLALLLFILGLVLIGLEVFVLPGF